MNAIEIGISKGIENTKEPNAVETIKTQKYGKQNNCLYRKRKTYPRR